jgi:hypothetical protein
MEALAVGGKPSSAAACRRCMPDQARSSQEFPMFDDLRFPVRRLPRGAVLRVPEGLGRAVVCLEGCLWITVDDDPRDVVLDPGERHVFDRGGRVLVSALEPSALLLLDLGGQVVATGPRALEAVAR